MMPNVIAEKLKRKSKDEFKGRQFEARQIPITQQATLSWQEDGEAKEFVAALGK